MQSALRASIPTKLLRCYWCGNPEPQPNDVIYFPYSARSLHWHWGNGCPSDNVVILKDMGKIGRSNHNQMMGFIIPYSSWSLHWHWDNRCSSYNVVILKYMGEGGHKTQLDTTHMHTSWSTACLFWLLPGHKGLAIRNHFPVPTHNQNKTANIYKHTHTYIHICKHIKIHICIYTRLYRNSLKYMYAWIRSYQEWF